MIDFRIETARPKRMRPRPVLYETETETEKAVSRPCVVRACLRYYGLIGQVVTLTSDLYNIFSDAH